MEKKNILLVKSPQKFLTEMLEILSKNADRKMKEFLTGGINQVSWVVFRQQKTSQVQVYEDTALILSD